MTANHTLSESLSESETSLLLNTYMYLNYYEAEEGQTLAEILQDLTGLRDYRQGGVHYGEFEILMKAAKSNPGFGDLVISAQSTDLGFDSGTRACIFTEAEAGTAYVVYRGTGDGEWPDNGLGLTSAATRQQERALDYFERAMDRGGYTGNHRIIVTGHSKGGNKAQFVTLESKYGYLIDRCYSVDGQGFSSEAIKKWRQKYRPHDYEQRTGKLYGINGENDFVNALGYPIIPAHHIRYIYTPVPGHYIAGYHDIKYMFADLLPDGEVRFNGRSNYLTGGQGEWGHFAGRLSAAIMSLAPEERAGCAAVIMQLMELGGKRKSGLNGEKLTLAHWQDFFKAGIPAVISALIYSREGHELMAAVSGTAHGGGSILEVNPYRLTGGAGTLEQIAVKVEKIAEMTEEAAGQLKASMKYGFSSSVGITVKLKRERENLQKEGRQLRQMAAVLDQAAHIYLACEQTIASI